MKPVDKSAPPPPSTDPQTNNTTPADPPAPPPPVVQNYLQAFAESANIWIMVQGSWAPEVSKEPPPNSSIISAVKNFVGSLHGTVVQAIVLRNGGGWSSRRTP